MLTKFVLYAIIMKIEWSIKNCISVFIRLVSITKKYAKLETNFSLSKMQRNITQNLLNNFLIWSRSNRMQKDIIYRQVKDAFKEN